MDGRIDVLGHAGSWIAASIRGGLVYVDGDVGSRCAIALKGGELVVGGNAGYMTGFMMQTGLLVIGGDAGDGLGDSMYDGDIFVGGSVRASGAPTPWCEETADEEAAYLRTSSTLGIDAGSLDFTKIRWAGSSGTSRRRSSSCGSPHWGSGGRLSESNGRPGDAPVLRESPLWPARRHRGHPDEVPARPLPDAGILDAPRRADVRRPDVRPVHALARAPRGLPREVRDADGAGDTFAPNPVGLDRPITIVGMSYGALSRRREDGTRDGPRRAVGTSTTTGDGGMCPRSGRTSTPWSTRCSRPGTASTPTT